MKLMDSRKAAKCIHELCADNKSEEAKCFVPDQMRWTPEDLKYAHYTMIMGGPGLLQTGIFSKPEENPEGELIHKLRTKYLNDPRTLKMLDDIIYERTVFAKNY